MGAVLMVSFVSCGKQDTGNGQVESTATSEVGKEELVDISLDEIHAAVKEAYGEDYLPNQLYDAQTMEDIYGIKEEWVEEEIAEVPMISANVDTFLAVKAKSEYVDQVKEAIESYREILISDTMQYPVNIPKIQASQIEVYGDYLFFIMLGVVPMEVEEQGEEAILEKAKENNQVAVNTIKEKLGVK